MRAYVRTYIYTYILYSCVKYIIRPVLVIFLKGDSNVYNQPGIAEIISENVTVK